MVFKYSSTLVKNIPPYSASVVERVLRHPSAPLYLTSILYLASQAGSDLYHAVTQYLSLRYEVPFSRGVSLYYNQLHATSITTVATSIVLLYHCMRLFPPGGKCH